MRYIKSYCYSAHELPFIIAQLEESFYFIDKIYLYEFNYTHTGIKKDFEIYPLLGLIPKKYLDKLVYKQIDLEGYVEFADDDEDIIHRINEPIQRSWFFNDPDVTLNDEDIIIDLDVDEIVYRDAYPELYAELTLADEPISLTLNQFFYTHTCLWVNCNFSSPAIYKYFMVRNSGYKLKGLKIQHQRDLARVTKKIYGAHFSWIMPIDFMLKKLYSYSHPKYRQFAQAENLRSAIDKREYIFDPNRDFCVKELAITDIRIPASLQKNVLFDYLKAPPISVEIIQDRIHQSIKSGRIRRLIKRKLFLNPTVIKLLAKLSR